MLIRKLRALLWLMFIFAGWAAAAESDPASEADPTVSEETAVEQTTGESGETEPDPEGDEASEGEPNLEVFIPTEEISEDFAVSFPVDI